MHACVQTSGLREKGLLGQILRGSRCDHNSSKRSGWSGLLWGTSEEVRSLDVTHTFEAPFFSSIKFCVMNAWLFILMLFLSFSTFNWSVPFLSWLAITVLCAGATLIYYIPLRYIVLVWGEKSYCFCILNTFPTVYHSDYFLICWNKKMA